MGEGVGKTANEFSVWQEIAISAWSIGRICERTASKPSVNGSVCSLKNGDVHLSAAWLSEIQIPAGVSLSLHGGTARKASSREHTSEADARSRRSDKQRACAFVIMSLASRMVGLWLLLFAVSDGNDLVGPGSGGPLGMLRGHQHARYARGPVVTEHPLAFFISGSYVHWPQFLCS